MIQQFICKDTDCPNFDIIYNMETTDKVVECGGCHVMLMSENDGTAETSI